MSSKKIRLFGFTDASDKKVIFDVQGPSNFNVTYQSIGDLQLGLMQKNSREAELTWEDKDFHIEFYCNESEIKHYKTTIDADNTDECFGNDPWLRLKNQTASFGSDWAFNYGVTETCGEGEAHKAYAYIASNPKNWMNHLRANTKVKELVLPGAHDAGMNLLDYDGGTAELFVNEINKFIDKINKSSVITLPHVNKNTVENEIVKRILAGVSVTQKDTFSTMLRLGTRFFDFRPAKLHSSGTSQPFRHVHNFLTGSTFESFLGDIASFLENSPSEIVFVVVRNNGINNRFKFIPRQDVQKLAEKAFSGKNVGYDLVNDFTSYHSKTIGEIRNSKKRAIFIYNPTNVNDSYDDNAYSKSTERADAIMPRLESTLKNNGNQNYTVLSLQSNAVQCIITEPQDHAWQWYNLAKSVCGNILQ